MKALDRLRCWPEAFAALPKGPDNAIGDGALWLWLTYGFHVAESMLGAALVASTLKAHLPPYRGPAQTLFRGELETRHLAGTYGIAWTPHIDIARMFASRRLTLAEGKGVVLRLQATTEMIVAAPTAHSEWLGEHEFVLDPSMIGRPEIVL